MKAWPFHLNDGQLERIVREATKRAAYDGVNFKGSDELTTYQTHYLGLIGETGVSLLEGKPINQLNGADWHDPDVGFWEVKSTRNSPPWIKVPFHQGERYLEMEKPRAMLAVYVNPPHGGMVGGWAWSHEVIRECNLHVFPTKRNVPREKRTCYVFRPTFEWRPHMQLVDLVREPVMP